MQASPPPLAPGLSSLMDKIRGKASMHRSWPDLVKLTKSALVDKRSILVSDSSERAQVEKCLETIQKNIRVTGLRSMIERLETITRQLGLKFTAGPTGKDVFISSDMFYVEVVLDPATGYVNDVKVAHQADPVSCPEMTNVLRASDFAEFTKHMEGIAAIYQLNADSKQKSKAYMSLHFLETDLCTLAKMQSCFTDPMNIIHKTPVGILEPRKGGHAMKLTFFVSPYDLIDRKTKSAHPLNIETVSSKKLGYYASICIESSSRSHTLQAMTLITVQQKGDGKKPAFPRPAAFDHLNSSSLPACFVLKLDKPLPLCRELVQQISAVTGIDFVPADQLTTAKSLIYLIAQNVLSEKEREKLTDDASANYYARLPDQEHVYFIHQDTPQLKGVTVSSIPFTHPTHVPQTLTFLRQQILFNVIIGSTMRKVSAFGSSDPHFSFEITTQNLSHISVSFEHPVEESLASLEIDLVDIANVKCKLYDPSSFANLCNDDYVSKIMQR
jgi:mediator of RNA polymerase II transcription subunit 1